MNSHPVQLILASQSPRRRQLLAQAGFEFIVDAPDDDVERHIQLNGGTLSPEQLVLASSSAKAAAIAVRHTEGIVLAADTVAECDGEILGKPTDRTDAKRMLTLMSGKRHCVLTGVCLHNCQTGQRWQHVEKTVLEMSQFPASDLEEYLDSGQWRGKAGAFGYQDGLEWVRIVSGLESNVVGLPVERLPAWLDQH